MSVNEGEGEGEGEDGVVVVLVGWPFVASPPRTVSEHLSSLPQSPSEKRSEKRAALDATPIMTRWVNDSDLVMV